MKNLLTRLADAHEAFYAMQDAAIERHLREKMQAVRERDDALARATDQQHIPMIEHAMRDPRWAAGWFFIET